MKKIYSSIMAVALFASALSCTSGNNNNTNNAGTQTAQTQALDSDGIPTGGEWITMFDGKTLNGWRGYCRQDVPQGWVVEDGSITYKGSENGRAIYEVVSGSYRFTVNSGEDGGEKEPADTGVVTAAAGTGVAVVSAAGTLWALRRRKRRAA